VPHTRITGAIDELSNQVNLYNQIVDEKNESIKKLHELNKLLIEKDNVIVSLKNLAPTIIKETIEVEKVVEKPTFIEKTVEVPVEKTIYVDRIVEVPFEKVVYVPKEILNVKNSIIVQPKIIESSIFNNKFKVQCINLKNDLEPMKTSRTIQLTKENINLVSQLKLGVGDKKKKILLKYLDKITTLGDLIKIKIGIGARTVEKLKRYFHINNFSPNIVNELINNNLPDDVPPDKQFFSNLVNSINNLYIRY
jgi:hypothetical protein